MLFKKKKGWEKRKCPGTAQCISPSDHELPACSRNKSYPRYNHPNSVNTKTKKDTHAHGIKFFKKDIEQKKKKIFSVLKSKNYKNYCHKKKLFFSLSVCVYVIYTYILALQTLPHRKGSNWCKLDSIKRQLVCSCHVGLCSKLKSRIR